MPESDTPADKVHRLKRKAYDTEAEPEMTSTAECGGFRFDDELEEGATLRVDDITDDYVALVGFKGDGVPRESSAYFQLDFDDARDLAAALEAAVDLHEEVR